MDPRHPELAIARMEELMTQFDRVLSDIRSETISSKLGGLEREGSLVIQELCLVAPRLHEAMMQTSRQRRYDLAHGIAFGYTPEEKAGKYIKATIGLAEKPIHDGYLSVDEVIEEISTQPNQAETVIVEPKPRKKKKTSKKKKAE